MILPADICLQRFLFSAGRCCSGRVVLKMKGEDMHFLQQKMNDLLTTDQFTYKELRSTISRAATMPMARARI